MKLLSKIKGLFHKHKYRYECDGLKRFCDCGAEDWVMSKPYPKIGEPKYYWKNMSWKDFK